MPFNCFVVTLTNNLYIPNLVFDLLLVLNNFEWSFVSFKFPNEQFIASGSFFLWQLIVSSFISLFLALVSILFDPIPYCFFEIITNSWAYIRSWVKVYNFNYISSLPTYSVFLHQHSLPTYSLFLYHQTISILNWL